MILSRAVSTSGALPDDVVKQALISGLQGQFTAQKVLVLIPDHTRSLPLPELFRYIVDILQDARQLDFMVALGTHPALSEEELNKLVGVSDVARKSTYSQIGLFNHTWNTPESLTSLGIMEHDEIRQLAGSHWHPTLPDRIDMRINKAALNYDHILIIGPTFPHEVAGFSGGAKYLFPGISGPDMINATHWLGALASVVGTIGIKETPVRAMIHSAASRLKTPVTLAAFVVDGHDLAGVFIGDVFDAWAAAADLSAQVNIRWCSKPYQQVLSWAPPMYDELWTAAKAMYKLEPVVAVGGEVIIYAPHLEVVSRVHGKYINEIGYHILPYFLNHWPGFKHIPLGVLAHSTHVRGSGVMAGGIEKPNVRVTLASRIPPEDCARLNLGYQDPQKINLSRFQNREDKGILFVPRAGEVLYRLIGQ
jgi:lactate racemase